MEFKHFLKKWRFNRTVIAEKLELSTSGFLNKLSEKNADKLTEAQKEKLKLIVKELTDDLNNIEI